MRSHLAAFAAGALVATAIGAHARPGSRDRDRYASLDTFAQALSYITNNYVDEVDEQDLMYGGIRGMVDRLDPHSSFLPPRKYQRLREDTEGAFGGVGITLGPARAGDDPAYPIVSAVGDRSPAARAGIRPGDRIVEIGARRTAERGVAPRRPRSWHSELRGRTGTRVELTIARVGRPDPFEIALVRERIKVPTVDHESLEAGVGLIAISRFQEATSEDVLGALKSIQKANAGKPLRALVLDLRDNPGGLLDQAVRVADLFLDAGTIVTVSGRGGALVDEEVARGPGTWKGFPMIVLVDHGSASAAEIVAGALQDHGRATILGTATYGKGSVQTFMDLDDGSGLKLTTSRYYTPGGRSLHGSGIVPDVWVDPTQNEHAATAGTFSSTNAKINQRLRDDPTLAVAYRTIRGWLGGKGP